MPQFKPILDAITANDAAAENGIEDGRFSLTYDRLTREFARLADFLRQAGDDGRGVLALECGNRLPDALVLLHLLVAGRDVILKSRPEKARPEDDDALSLAALRLTIAESVNLDEDGASPDPETYIRVLPGPARGVRADTLRDSEPRIYIRTSGSTGQAKLAVHRHRQLLGNVLACQKRLGIERDDRVAIPIPLSHMYGLGAAFLPALAVCASIDLQPGANLLRFKQREKEFCPNVAFLTPTFAATLVSRRASAPAFRMIVTAGDRLPRKTFDQCESRLGPVVQLYGSTEMGVIAASTPSDPPAVRANSVGRPLPGVEVRPEAPGPSTPTNNGEAQLLVKQVHGFDGYATGSDSAEHTPSRDGDWLATGDLGRINVDGTITVLGRCDDAVNRDGLLVLLADVEAAISTIPGVQRAAAIIGEEAARGRGITVCCVIDGESDAAPEAIRSACFDLLPRHAIPDRIVLLADLPTLTNGKLDRIGLRARLIQEEAASSTFQV